MELSMPQGIIKMELNYHGEKIPTQLERQAFFVAFYFFSLIGSVSLFNNRSGYLVKPVSFDDFLKVVKQISEY